MIKLTFGFEPSQHVPEEATKETVYLKFLEEFDSVTFYGLTSAFSIKPMLSRELLNLSLFFRKENLYLSANEIEITLALSLINGKQGSSVLSRGYSG